MLIYQFGFSEGADVLRQELGLVRIWPENTRTARGKLAHDPRGTPHNAILNWGSARVPEWEHFRQTRWINSPEAVGKALSKVRTYNVLREAEISAVQNTRNEDVAHRWNAAGECLTRIDRLSNGRGIEEGMLPLDTPRHFWSRRYEKTHEFRAHVFADQVIMFYEKKQRRGMEVNRLIRSFDNGWTWVANEMSIGDAGAAKLKLAAVQAVRALGLDFGAVDLLAILRRGEYDGDLLDYRVCEVNTAPAIDEPRTVAAYCAALRIYL